MVDRCKRTGRRLWQLDAWQGVVLSVLVLALSASAAHAQLQQLWRDMTGEKGEPTQLYIVFADVSGSVPEEDWQIYERTFSNLLSALAAGDRVILAKISDVSLTGFAPVADRALSATGRLKTDTMDHERAVGELRTAFQSLRQGAPANRTLVLDALTLSQQLIEQNPEREPVIVILSDMLEYSHIANFETGSVGEKEATALIERQKQHGVLPDLHNAKIYVAGAKAKTSDRFATVQSFWLRYFEQANAKSGSGTYGRAAVSFASN